MPMVQCVLGNSVAPQFCVAMVKAVGLAPPMAIEEICSTPVPLLVSVSVHSVLVVPTDWLPKVRLDGVSRAAGLVDGDVPLSGIDCGLLAALLLGLVLLAGCAGERPLRTPSVSEAIRNEVPMLPEPVTAAVVQVLHGPTNSIHVRFLTDAISRPPVLSR